MHQQPLRLAPLWVVAMLSILVNWQVQWKVAPQQPCLEQKLVLSRVASKVEQHMCGVKTVGDATHQHPKELQALLACKMFENVKKMWNQLFKILNILKIYCTKGVCWHLKDIKNRFFGQFYTTHVLASFSLGVQWSQIKPPARSPLVV